MRLYPIYHPAAALYTPKMLDVLREDFHRLPALLALDPPEQPDLEAEDERSAVPEPELVAEPEPAPDPSRRRSPRRLSSGSSEPLARRS